MKKIEAIIRRSKFEEVKAALHAIDIDFFSYTESFGVGNERKKKNVFRGSADTDYISLTRPALDIEIGKRIKSIFDPTGLFNPGVLYVD